MGPTKSKMMASAFIARTAAVVTIAALRTMRANFNKDIISPSQLSDQTCKRRL